MSSEPKIRPIDRRLVQDPAHPERLALLRRMWDRARHEQGWPRTRLEDLAKAIGRDQSGLLKALQDPPARPLSQQHCEMLIGFLKGRGIDTD